MANPFRACTIPAAGITPEGFSTSAATYFMNLATARDPLLVECEIATIKIPIPAAAGQLDVVFHVIAGSDYRSLATIFGPNVLSEVAAAAGPTCPASPLPDPLAAYSPAQIKRQLDSNVQLKIR